MNFRTWDESYEHLQAYTEKHGTACVPHRATSGRFAKQKTRLGEWVAQQRRYYKDGELTPAKIRKLQKLTGWVWDFNMTVRMKKLKQLKAYYKEFGTSRVSRDYRCADGFNLYEFVKMLRKSYKDDSIYCTPEVIAFCEALPDWQWAPHANRSADCWNHGFDELMDFLHRFGDVVVSVRYKCMDEFALGQWIKNQRYREKNGSMTTQQRSKLNMLKKYGWKWSK